jgi:hypothetical protein
MNRTIPTPVAYDERYTDQAFAAYKQEHGFGDGIRLGDMPLRIMSEILRKAQELKQQESAR